MQIKTNVRLLQLLLLIALCGKSAQQATMYFYCNDGNKVDAARFCDGSPDCEDGSDELTHNTNNNNYHMNCTVPTHQNTCLLHRDYFCNRTVSCQGSTPCDVGCTNYYKCQNSNTCVPRTTVCDGDSCNGCPEDDEWENGAGFKCVRNGKFCRLPQQLLWDNVKDCDDGLDLCYKNTSAFVDGRDMRRVNSVLDTSKCFQCLDGKTVIPRSKVCDVIFNCPDLSDECLCDKKVPRICNKIKTRTFSPQKTGVGSSPCMVGEIACNGKNSSTCVKRSQICDGKTNCKNKRDEWFRYCRGTLPCREGTEKFKEQKCRCPRPCVSEIGRICDEKADCSPPAKKSATWDIPPGYPADECRAKCAPSSGFNCTDPSFTKPIDAIRSVLCEAYDYKTTAYLLDGADGSVLSCQDFYPNGTQKVRQFQLSGRRICDGMVTCDVNFADELNCRGRFPCLSRRATFISIGNSEVCDGYKNCDDGSDEAVELCTNRFYCSALRGRKVSIRKTRVCDFVVNCDNAEDERNCSLSDQRFYCEGGNPLFVRGRKVFNGVGDCEDWSDECPTMVVPGSENLLSSRYELIGNPILRTVVWIMAVLALVGNTVVTVGEIKAIRMFVIQRKNPLLITNHMLVLNLAVADLLMAIYLLMLGIAGAVYSGSYCSQSLSWLTSSSCTTMGVLVVLSSEASTMTLILLTCVRLFAVTNPIKSRTSVTPHLMLIPVVCAWTLALTLALVPLSQRFEDTFVERAILEDNPFFSSATVHIEDAKSFVQKLPTFSPHFFNITSSEADMLTHATTWHGLEGALAVVWPESNFLRVAKYVGYYSVNSVCISKVFVTQNDRAWKYSLSISIFNFLAFSFVAGAYVTIIIRARKSSKMRMKSSNTSNTSDIQRKIIRLIVTDFCCWIPLSIMVFVNFSGVKIDSISYAVAAIVLLPINSALNPILYSNSFDTIWGKILAKFRGRKNDQKQTLVELTPK